ncbi:MAG: hypothetical protein U0132_09960 [Gemmatimonadaceae bacterium]
MSARPVPIAMWWSGIAVISLGVGAAAGAGTLFLARRASPDASVGAGQPSGVA